MNLRSLLTCALLAIVGLLSAGEVFAGRTTTYLHNDGLGSVVAATNETGQVLWRKHYEPFGEQISPPSTTVRTAYTGKDHDQAIGLTNFGARQYDPETGRFLSVDPVGFVENNPMSFNRYAYVNNNPYKHVDPDGEFLNFAAKFVLDVGVNVAFNYVTTGQMDVGGALKESAIGILNPAKTVAKMGKLAGALAKAEKKVGSGSLPKFTQTTASPTFRRGEFAGQSIGEVADGLRSGAISPAQLPVDVIVRNGQPLAMNTRSLLALRRAGIDPKDMVFRDKTGNRKLERALDKRLANNKLTNAGTETLRVTGAGENASNLQ